MENIAGLERRIRVLEEECRRLGDIEAIKKLRGKYWRCIRERLFYDLVECYSESASVNLGFGLHLDGKEAIARYYKETGGTLHNIIVPQGHNHEIEITGKRTAMGRWLIDNPQVIASTGIAARLGSTYEEEYVKEKGKWKIKKKSLLYL